MSGIILVDYNITSRPPESNSFEANYYASPELTRGTAGRVRTSERPGERTRALIST